MSEETDHLFRGPNMKTLVLSAAVALFTFAGTETADAGGRISVRVGGVGLRYNSSRFNRSNCFNNRHFSRGHIHHNVNPNPWNRGHYHWHDTSHWDYVPGGFVPHGNHFHYQPGGYYFHQDGHWDLHH